MFIRPLRKDFTDIVKFYIDDLNLSPKSIKIFIDIQNLSLGQYDYKVSEQYYLNENFNPVELLDELLLWISIKHNEIYHNLRIPAQFILYTDTGRNIFNETLIPGWKESRKKSYLKTKEEKPYEYQTMLFAKQTIDSIIDSLHKFANYSTALRTIILQNIDSDFIPAFLTDSDSLSVILSSDHDYYHMLTKENVIRYVFLTKTRDKLESGIEHMYNSFKLVGRKYNLDEDNAKLVARYYQVFHCLIGDVSDNVKSLIKGKGIKYWLKVLRNTLPKYDIDELRYMVCNNECFIPELLDYKADQTIYKSLYPKPETKWDEFRMRFMVFDFETTANIIRDNQPFSNLIQTYPKLANLVNEIRDSLDKQINTKNKLSIQEAESLFQSLGLENSTYIAQSLFY